MADHHRFDGKTGFFYNTDPECFNLHGLDHQKDYIGFFNGVLAAPKFVEYDVPISAEELDRILTD